MNDERVRVSKTMAFLLRHRPDVGGLSPDPEGYVTLAELSRALERLLRRPIAMESITEVAGDRAGRFELDGDRVRAAKAVRERKPRHAPDRSGVPDILFHATTEDAVERVLDAGRLVGADDRHLFLSADEAQAWRVAHRLSGVPRVICVDAARARRHGVRIWKSRRPGLFQTSSVPLSDLLNLQENYAEQVSAGGIPVRTGADGVRVALIRVSRKSGVTWEVAKGKLEDGEPPERAAVREVREEMGVTVDLRITRSLGIVRYGFLAPGGLPRLKTVHLFLMEPVGEIESFLPAEAEGIGAVGWFTPAEASRAVTHSSLVPLIREISAMLTPSAAQETEP